MFALAIVAQFAPAKICLIRGLVIQVPNNTVKVLNMRLEKYLVPVFFPFFNSDIWPNKRKIFRNTYVLECYLRTLLPEKKHQKCWSNWLKTTTILWMQSKQMSKKALNDFKPIYVSDINLKNPILLRIHLYLKTDKCISFLHNTTIHVIVS